MNLIKDLEKMKQLRISGVDYDALREHLYPSDGKEAISFALCGRLELDNFYCLTVHKLLHIPYGECKTRTSVLIQWPSTYIEELLLEADKKGLSVLKIHSHPTGYADFSKTDDVCDNELFRSIHGWVRHDILHASCVMLPNGEIFGRLISKELVFAPLNKIIVAGDSVKIWRNGGSEKTTDLDLRNLQAFGERTTKLLKSMKVTIVGCSGTGSVVAEQLTRLGVGELILIDHDKVELKNLNRILNTTKLDAEQMLYKVDVVKKRLEQVGFETKIVVCKENICDSRKVLQEIASSDFVIGCTDTIESRHFLNLLTVYYLLPFIDIGVQLRADGQNGISKIIGAVHYLQAKKSSLFSRGVYSMEGFESERLRRRDPEEYDRLLKENYIKGAGIIGSPAVISVNMQIASMAVNEFLNKIDPFKSCEESDNAIIRMLISDNIFENEPEGEADELFSRCAGLGDQKQFLGIIGL
jgi:hypothetical protein